MKKIITYRLLFLILVLTSCASSIKTQNSSSNTNSEEKIISEISTTNQLSLSRKDIANLFCNNLTEYFNGYKYYSISTKVYYENEKQNDIATSKITKRGSLYDVEFIGAAGSYVITFSNKYFYKSDEIITFVRQTVLGNAIRSKVYDTFMAWKNKEEIALKSNYKSYLYREELNAAIEIENWFNSLSSNSDSK
jgi:hypothetical protein